MAKQCAEIATPKLRFPAFVSERWDRAPGDKLFDQTNTRDAEAGLPILAITQEHGAIPRDLIDYHVSVTEKSIESYKVVERGDFIISLRSFQGGIEHSNYRGVCSPAYVVLRMKGDGFSDYFKHLFKSARFILQLTRNIEGLRDGKMISYKQFSDQLIPIPKPDEQQKIADCLSSLDEVIAAQGRKVEELKARKRGLMQQLFPREGETRPRLRFPEFRDAPEWTQETLGETTGVLMCKRVFASETNPLGGVPFYKIGTLGGVPGAYITKELFEDYRSRYSFPRVGEILITCSGTVGKCLRYDGSDAYFQDSNIVWIDNPAGAIGNDFLFALISNVDWSKLNSTTITRIYGPDLRGLSIKYPKDSAEQKRIADCLSSLDTQITAESNQLTALKTHKQGLMQQLFPALEATCL